MNIKSRKLVATVESQHAGKRLDQVLALLFPDYSRSRLQEWIKQGLVMVDGEQRRPRDKLLGGEQVELEARFDERVDDQPQALPLDLLYEDRDLLVINKPVGMVVHPAAGNPDGTLLNALLHYDGGLAALPRAGIVHRLDKDTSGVLVVARTPAAHKSLIHQLQARSMKREYRAVACGVLTAGGTVEEPIGRHPVNRIRMAVNSAGKPAVTHFRVLERFRAHSYLQVKLETGRTHQIRVHLAHIRYPLVGDPLYGGRLRMPAGASTELQETLRGFRRQALHAMVLGLSHPESGEWMEWEQEIPQDMQTLLQTLREDMARG
jgi:23S rRNA pseudouridine1911/1915/1917 synthase